MNKSLFLTPSTHLSISSCQVDFENAFKWLETVALERGSRYATDYVARSPILLLLLPYLAITLSYLAIPCHTLLLPCGPNSTSHNAVSAGSMSSRDI